MPQDIGSKYQIAKSLTVNTTVITTPPWFTGDFGLLTVSCSTQSNAAINVQANNGDGLQTPLVEADWVNRLAISTNSVFALSPIPRWSRISTPALSSSTIIFSGRY